LKRWDPEEKIVKGVGRDCCRNRAAEAVQKREILRDKIVFASMGGIEEIELRIAGKRELQGRFPF